jgi:hypothetical protein
MTNFMRILTQTIAAAFAATLAGASPAHTLPAAIGYTLFVDGVKVGRSDMKITTRKDAVVFESRTRVTLGPNVIDLTSRTEADPVTFHVRRFSFEGTKGGMATAAMVELAGDSATGWVQSVGATEKRPRTAFNPGGFVVWEDWVMDLEVALALRQRAAATDRSELRLVFANSFLPADLVAGFTGETEIQAANRSMVARRMEVFLFGGSPFFSNVDPGTGIPVYIEFPGTRTEAFRDDFFGDNPLSRYSAAVDK